ncbi:MAG: flagella basal body P-ring formation protein FlgA [Myxococcales bacterium]|nr:flagella basal body P-ring formation protein FlgA [Myxococcales bacterium]
MGLVSTILMALLAVSPGEFRSESPAEAVQNAAEYVTGETGMLPDLGTRTFVGLPEPAPGITFIARPMMGPNSSDNLVIEVVAMRGRNIVASRPFVFPREQLRQVVVAKRSIARGSRIQAGDVRLVERKRSAGPERHFTDLTAIVGQVTRTPIIAGRAISLRQVRRVYSVKRGDKVKVRVSTGSLQISMSGKAVENGATGDDIKILNPISGRVIVARVVGPGLMEVGP